MRRIYETKQEAQNYILFFQHFLKSNIFISLCNFSFMNLNFAKYCRISRWSVWIMSTHAHLAAGWCGFVRYEPLLQRGGRWEKDWQSGGVRRLGGPRWDPPLPQFILCATNFSWMAMRLLIMLTFGFTWIRLTETLFLQLNTWLKKITCEDIILLMYIQRIIVSLKEITCEGIFLLMYSICRLWWFVPIKC